MVYNAGEDTSYHLRYELGHGAEGKTWRADQEGPDGRILPVAIKILGDSWLGRPADAVEMLRKWRGQMHVLRNFNHEGFAAVQVAFPIAAHPQDEARTPAALVGAPAFVMGWVEGTNLHKWAATVGDPIRRVQVLTLAAQGLDAFHARTHHVHRDIKPDNIMVEDERSRMVDFGLIRSTTREVASSGFPGTAGYRDPSVVSARAYTSASDVFSFAGVIYHQLTGLHPVPYRTPDEITWELRQAGLERVAPLLAPALSPDPTARPTVNGAEDLLDRVLKLLRPAEAPPKPPKPRTMRRRPAAEATTRPYSREEREAATDAWVPVAMRIVATFVAVALITVVAVVALQALTS